MNTTQQINLLRKIADMNDRNVSTSKQIELLDSLVDKDELLFYTEIRKIMMKMNK